MLVFAINDYCVSDISRIGVKLSSWGKNSLGGQKQDSKMCWVQLLPSTIQFLCISIPQILLHVTLKRQAEIWASCKNLTLGGGGWGELP